MYETVFYNLTQSNGLAYSLADQIAKEIGRKIVAAHYSQGKLIEDESTLSEYYKVSRSVIRDAVKILVGKGLLEVRRGIGTRVRDRHTWRLFDCDVMAWYISAPLRPEFLEQLMDFRIAIEPKAARWAAQKGTDYDLSQIEYAHNKMDEEKESTEDFVVADALFHRSILKATNNEILISMESAICSALIQSIRLTNKSPKENVDSIPFHKNVMEAIIARDENKAELLMEQLLQDSQKRIRIALETPFQN